ncbi:MAG: hypothetical protein ACE5MM_06945 [Nitrospiraceae bacterium]
MPVNMSPKRGPEKPEPEDAEAKGESTPQEAPPEKPKKFGELTQADREADLAEAEWKHLWEENEPIDGGEDWAK